jgi:hypothetical protein
MKEVRDDDPRAPYIQIADGPQGGYPEISARAEARFVKLPALRVAQMTANNAVGLLRADDDRVSRGEAPRGRDLLWVLRRKRADPWEHVTDTGGCQASAAGLLTEAQGVPEGSPVACHEETRSCGSLRHEPPVKEFAYDPPLNTWLAVPSYCGLYERVDLEDQQASSR